MTFKPAACCFIRFWRSLTTAGMFSARAKAPLNPAADATMLAIRPTPTKRRIALLLDRGTTKPAIPAPPWYPLFQSCSITRQDPPGMSGLPDLLVGASGNRGDLRVARRGDGPAMIAAK